MTFHPEDAPDATDDDQLLEETQPPTLWQRLKPWLPVVAGLAAVCLIAYLAAERAYHPRPRIPEPAFETGAGLLGTHQGFHRELEAAADLLGVAPGVELELGDVAYDLDFPRTVADRLFGERDESATIFSAATSSGRLRFLVLWDGAEPALLAVESPSGARGSSGPEGLFLALPPSQEGRGSLAELAGAIEARLADLDRLPAEKLSSDGYVLFGPFGLGDTEPLRARIDDNTVIAHLVGAMQAASADVSLVAPAFLLLEAPQRGTIRALYLSGLGLIQAPLWGESTTSSLAHELVHAYLDHAVASPEGILGPAVAYLEEAHPRLYGRVVSDLYESLPAEGRAEEALAFLTGAVANRQTRTEPTLQVLENQGRLSFTEPVLLSDVRLLADLGLLPPCMALDAAPSHAEVTPEFYEAADAACSDDPATPD